VGGRGLGVGDGGRRWACPSDGGRAEEHGGHGGVDLIGSERLGFRDGWMDWFVRSGWDGNCAAMRRGQVPCLASLYTSEPGVSCGLVRR
jgi:hypothetical protein